MPEKKCSCLCIAVLLVVGCPSAVAASDSFAPEIRTSINIRNMFMSRNYVGSAAKVSKRQEWGQGAFFRTLIKPNHLGSFELGAEILGKGGIRLDGGGGRSGLGLFPKNENGPSRSFGRIGGSFKIGYLGSEMTVGEQLLSLPVIKGSDARLAVQTYDGVTVKTKALRGFEIYAGNISKTSTRDSSGMEKLSAQGSKAQGEYFSYIGVDADVAGSGVRLSYWKGQLKDIYTQDMYKVAYAVRPWGLNIQSEAGLFLNSENGAALDGQIDNKAVWASIRTGYQGHSAMIGYQRLFGKSDFPYLQDGATGMVNHASTYFGYAQEKSLQLRYDYNFAAAGIPGLSVMARYIKGWDAESARGVKGDEWERGVMIQYVFQQGSMKDLNFMIAQVTSRADTVAGVDEVRVVVNYPLNM